MAGEVKKVQSVQRDIADCRSDFPILQQGIAYLDSAASAQKPQQVITAMSHAMETYYANIHRGLYEFSQRSTSEFEAVRVKAGNLINASSSQEVVFTRNATEAINLIAHSWGGAFLEEGDEIILSGMEHHANIVPWRLLADRMGLKIKVIPVLEDGTLDMAAYERLFSPATKLVSVVHVSNSLGTINNVKEIIRLAKDFYPECKVMIDGSQGVVHNIVDVQDLGCDFYVYTGHKLYGPSGIGVLWGRYDLLAQMPPYQGGGDMIDKVSFDYITYKEPPARFEAGTPAIVDAIGLGAAIDYVRGIGAEAIIAHESALYEYAMERLTEIDGLRFYGQAPEKAAIISFTADWAHPSDIGMILDQCGVAVRTGHHCCQPLMARFGVDATIRASIGLYSHKEDIDALIAGLEKAKSMLDL